MKEIVNVKELKDIVIKEALIKKGNSIVFTSNPEDPNKGITVIFKWGGEEGEEKEQDQDQQQQGQQGKEGQQEGQDQDQGQEDGGDEGQGEEGDGLDSPEGSSGKSPPNKNKDGKKEKGGKGKGGGGEEDGDEEGDDEKGEGGKSSREKGGKQKEGDEEGDDGEGQEGGDEGKEGGKEGREKDGKKGNKEDGEGKEKGDREGQGGQESSERGSSRRKDGSRGKGSLDDITIDDILGGGGQQGSEEDDDQEHEGPGGDPGGEDDSDDAEDEDSDKETDKSSKKDKKGGKSKSKNRENQVEDEIEVSSDISEVPPPPEELDPKIFDVFFGKEKVDVEEKENKVIHKSFVFKSEHGSINVYKLTPKGKFSIGDKSYIKSLANLVYYLYEPYLKAPSVTLDPGVPVVSTPISPKGLRSEEPHERPKISYGAISTLDKVDFSKLILFIDISGSMDMRMVSRVLNSYFLSIFPALKKNRASLVKAIVVLHGTNVGVFGVVSSWGRLSQVIAGVAESSREIVGMGNGSESTLTHRIVDILKTTSPIPGVSQFIYGQVPVIWITDFYWSISVSTQLTKFLSNKPALLISTVEEPEKDKTFGEYSRETSMSILKRVPYGALIYFPSFASYSSSPLDPETPASGTARVYAKGLAYEQLTTRKDKLGRISIYRVR